jgi:ABC-type transport system involved in multi-copper enzyme maturation permease subunit
MTTVFLWKEYREHRPIWLAMVVLAVVGLVGARVFLDPSSRPDLADSLVSVLGLLTAGLVVMQGLVCGAMMLAGERESRTTAFLNMLPQTRHSIFFAKILIGAVFTLIYTLCVSTLFGFLVANLENWHANAFWIVMIAPMGLEAFAWGMAASVYCRSVLPAVAIGACASVALGLMPAILMTANPNPGSMDSILIARYCFVIVPLAMLGFTGLHYSRPDWERIFDLSPSQAKGDVAPKRHPRAWEVMMWLWLREGRIVVPVLAVPAAVLGLWLPDAGAFLWPTATLLVGVTCGLMVFAGEQAEGAYKFWGDQRLPAGWIWLRRSLVWLGVGVAVAALMVLTATMRILAKDSPDALAHFDDRYFEAISGTANGAFRGIEWPTVAILWLLHGFAFGQYSALVWKKNAVAVVVAVAGAAGASCVWVPSLIGGGLHVWQVAVVPLLLLATCRLTLWLWVTERIKTRSGVLRLGGGAVVATLGLGLCLAARVFEVPSGAIPAEVYTPAPPSPEIDEARIRGARLRALLGEMDKDDKPIGNFGEAQAIAAPRRSGEKLKVSEQLTQPFQLANREQRSWLDQMSRGAWVTPLAKSAREPALLVESRSSGLLAADVKLCHRAVEFFLLRSEELLFQEHDGAALDHALTALALVGQIRQQMSPEATVEGIEVERIVVDQIVKSLVASERRSSKEHVRRALDELSRHEFLLPPLSEFIWLRYRQAVGDLEGASGTGTRDSANIRALLSQLPWEAGRSRRLADDIFAGKLRAAEAGQVPSGTGILDDWAPDPSIRSAARLEQLIARSWIVEAMPETAEFQRSWLSALCRLRLARIQLALVLYRIDKGSLPATLDQLVGLDYLKEIPTDPFGDGRFHYQCANGRGILSSPGAGDRSSEIIVVVPPVALH